MGEFIKKLKKVQKRAQQIKKPDFFARKKYIWYMEHCAIEEKTVFLESSHGENLGGNIMALARELATNPAYEEYRICITFTEKNMEERLAMLERYGLQRLEVIAYGTKEYHKVLATAKYLINDTSFSYHFYKRPGQVYLNTWHGTPLKAMGKAMTTDTGTIGNIQRNFFMSDYMLTPNEFTLECMTRDYMLNNFGNQTKLWLTGYPRISTLFYKERREELRRALGVEDKQVIAYLPTWRGLMSNGRRSKQNALFAQYLQELDERLKPNQVVYVKLHVLARAKINLEEFEHILPYPEEYETYDFLNATDLLLTDYSSVFFDYSVTGRKIVLFTYDKEEYLAERGLYFPMEELPFPQVQTVEELVEELNAPKNYEDAAFIQKFAAYEDISVPEAVCRKLLFGEDSKRIEERNLKDNGKKNVYIYLGDFQKNGITMAARSLLDNLDTTKYNYNVLYRMRDVKSRQEVLKELPRGVASMGFAASRGMTFWESMRYLLWMELQLYPYKGVARILDRWAEREKLRVFGGCRVDKLVQFYGYSNEMTVLIEKMPCSKTIFVHNDMIQEYKMKHNIDLNVLGRAYRTYDTVAVVSKELIPSVKQIMKRKYRGAVTGENIRVVRNVIDYKNILNRAQEEVVFDKKTKLNTTQEHFYEVLASEKKKFITIGRYSAEKGHERLISAFEKIHEKHPDTCLIIIGGYGPLYGETQKRAEASICPEDILLVRYITNPYAILGRCDYFVLASYHEGLPLVLSEADILGKPVVSTDIAGPHAFLEELGGRLVDNSEEGILKGMEDCLYGRVPNTLSVDYADYVRNAVAQFEALLP